MADLGFKELSMEPVVSKPDTDYALKKKEDLDTLFEQYEILAKEMIKEKEKEIHLHFYHYMIDLSGDHAYIKNYRLWIRNRIFSSNSKWRLLPMSSICRR